MTRIVEKLVGALGLSEDSVINANASSIIEEVSRAKQEWLTAHQYFESVSDPDLVDHAISLCNAAEQKYEYLLRMAKREGVNGTYVNNFS